MFLGVWVAVWLNIDGRGIGKQRDGVVGSTRRGEGGGLGEEVAVFGDYGLKWGVEGLNGGS